MSEISSKEYKQHMVFDQLKEYAEFYQNLSFHIMGWKTMGVLSIINLDTYVFNSIHGTLESIQDILLKGRINDSYALLRKYFDATVIHIYSNLYLEDRYAEEIIVLHINDWIKGNTKIPRYGTMANYINNSSRIQPINNLLQKDECYKNIRERCNNHTHYNFFQNLILNDTAIYLRDRIKVLDAFSLDVRAIFIQHLAYLFYLKDNYLMAEDYIDSLEMGITPNEESLLWVSPFIQDVFDKVIKPSRPDIVDAIKRKTLLHLQ